MLVYFKVNGELCSDEKFIWKWFTCLDSESNTFDYLIRTAVRDLCKEFDGVDGYITTSQPTVNGDWIVEFSVISKNAIKEEPIDVRNSRTAY